MTRCASAALLAATCLAATSCAGNTRQSAYAVWADDQSEALVVTSRWKEGTVDYMGSHSMNDFRFALRTYSLDGTRLRTLVGETDGEANNAWYMRSEGYVLLRYVAGDCCTAAQAYVTERVSLDGTRRILETGVATIWLPSPDGRVLAHIGELVGECSPEDVCTYPLTFIDAATLEPIGAPTSIDLANGGLRYVFWTPLMELYVYVESRAFDVGYSSVLVTPGSAPRAVEPLPCTQETPRPSVLPATSSEYVSHDGRVLHAAVDVDDHVTLTIEDTGMPGWPTRCFPGATP